MKILLCAVNAKYIHSNLAVYSIRANAREYRDQIELGEYTINQYVEDILQDIYKKKPDLIAFSCYIWNIRHIRELVRELRKVLPNVPIWLGGPEASYDAKELMERYPEVTGVLVGEGEESFYELCKYYDGKLNSLAEVKGIAYRENEEIIIKPFELVKDLSSLAFAYEDFQDFEIVYNDDGYITNGSNHPEYIPAVYDISTGEEIDIRKLADQLEYNDSSVLGEIMDNVQITSNEQLFNDCMYTIRSKELTKKEQEIIMRLSMADEEENIDSIRELTEELMKIQKLLKNR